MTFSLWLTFILLFPCLITTSSLDYFFTQQTGEGTYYGGGDSTAACGLYPLPAFASSLTRVALNTDQFQSGDLSQGCGMCVTLHGTGSGNGADPIIGPIYAYVNDLCPGCSNGDLDLGINGDGRWQIEWKANDCPVGDTYLQYLFQGSNDYYIKVQVRNNRVPVSRFEFQGGDGVWYVGVRTSDNFWTAPSGFPFPFTFPLEVRVTSVADNQVLDSVPELCSGRPEDVMKNI